MKTISHPASTRGQSVALMPDGRQKTSSMRPKDEVLAFQFEPLIDRMMEKYGWSRVEAELGFEDMKKFLYLCATNRGQPLAPPERIDEVWHNFILFTEDYKQYCEEYFERFIHHRPRRKEDMAPRQDMAWNTMKLAMAEFGELSPNWMFIRKDGSVLNAEASLSCVPSCSHGAPSTNCQN